MCSRKKGNSKRGKKCIIQAPTKYVLVRLYLEIKSASFINSSGKPLHFLKRIRKFSEIEISVPSLKESRSPSLSQPHRTKLQVPEQNISNNSILPESLCQME